MQTKCDRLEIGDRVTHSAYPEFFGHGTVMEIDKSYACDPDSFVHAVQWDKRNEDRGPKRLDRGYFTGALRKLTVLESLADQIVDLGEI